MKKIAQKGQIKKKAGDNKVGHLKLSFNLSRMLPLFDCFIQGLPL